MAFSHVFGAAEVVPFIEVSSFQSVLNREVPLDNHSALDREMVYH